MSIELVAKAKKTRLHGDSTAKLLLIVLADYANDEGMSMTPGELIVEFMDLISDRNSQTGNPYLYVMPLPGMVVIDRRRRRVSARVEYVSKSKLRSGNEASDR